MLWTASSVLIMIATNYGSLYLAHRGMPAASVPHASRAWACRVIHCKRSRAVGRSTWRVYLPVTVCTVGTAHAAVVQTNTETDVTLVSVAWVPATAFAHDLILRAVSFALELKNPAVLPLNPLPGPALLGLIKEFLRRRHNVMHGVHVHACGDPDGDLERSIKYVCRVG